MRMQKGFADFVDLWILFSSEYFWANITIIFQL